MMQKRKAIILIVSIVTLLLLGLGPSVKQMNILFKNATYFIILILFIMWTLRLIGVYGNKFKQGLKAHWPALLLSFVLVAFIFVISPPKFKVLTDEANLIGVSMMMHEDKTAALPIEGIYRDFAPPKFTTKIDKRPVFFPFLVSLVHAAIGYSPYNGFILNFILGCALLFCMYLTVSTVLTRTYGLLSVLLLASAPIFVVYVTSSGFEVLNALFLVFSFLILIKVCEHRNETKTTELLLLTLLLLAQCRYESLIILPLFIIILLPLLWQQKFFRKMSFLSCLMPLFLLPVVWQRMLYLDLPVVNKVDFNLFQRITVPFSLKNLIQNVDDNIYVLLGIDPKWGFSFILAGLGLTGIYLMGKNLVLKNGLYIKKSVIIAGITAFVLLLAIISAFYWGKFTIHMDNRLALAFLPFIVWASMYGLYCIGRHIKRPSAVTLTILFIFHLLFFWPFGDAQRVSNFMVAPREYRSAMAFLNANYQNRSDTLILAEHPNMYIIHKYSAYSTSSIDKMLEALPDTKIKRIVALQEFNVRSGKIATNSRLDDQIETKVVEVISITPDWVLKISECRYNPDSGNLIKQDPPPMRDKQL
ncbi:MAG: glycosyltransferase family 39 protein [Desulfobacterales bacterium]|jgi:hypothetical protein